MMTIKTVDGVCHAQIEGDMTIYTAAECRNLLLECLHGAAEVEIDLSDVAEIDSAGVQLLMQAKREGAAHGKRVRLVAHSPAAQEIIDLFGLAGAFGDPMIISPGA